MKELVRCGLVALVIVSVSAGVPRSAVAKEATAPVPKTDPSTWVTTKDYPSSELGRGAAGTTAVALAVDRDGVVSDCGITASSGFAALDATACALLKARARFVPGRDGNGRKIETVWRTRIAWKIP
jgi:protein TonB